MTEQPLVQPIQNPLTLVMRAKCPNSAAELRKTVERLQSLPQDQNPFVAALNKIGTVHFARFVFLDNDQFAVITTYDHDLENYLNEFVNELGEIFNTILKYIENAPPLPVQTHRQEFIEYVRSHDLRCVGQFYSSYPDRTVLDILAPA
jgi:hypothetical protein